MKKVALKQRIFSNFAPSGPHTSTPSFVVPACRKSWTDEQMENALQAVLISKKTVRQAAAQFGVPKSTLHDRICGKVKPGAVSGYPRYLDDKEEEELVRSIEGCAQIGYAKNVKEIRAIVGAIVARKNGLDGVVISHGWWDCFRQRHPHLSLRTGEGLAYQRAVSTNRIVIDKYFDLLEDVLETNNLTRKPHRIFNADETGMPLQHRPGRRVAVRGQKHVHVVNSGKKEQVTVLACASASGYVLPPMIVYKRKNLIPQLTVEEVDGTIYGLSSSGWMDGELFQEWFHSHFLQYAPATRPLLLLLDGHSSHYRLEFISEACVSGVCVFCLPPNTTHVCQPLDVTPFNSLKVHWDNVCDEFMSANPGRIVTLHQFCTLFSRAWRRAMVPETIISGFRAAGVFPPNRRAIRIPGEIPTITNTPTAVIARRQGIRYMPFLSSTQKELQESRRQHDNAGSEKLLAPTRSYDFRNSPSFDEEAVSSHEELTVYLSENDTAPSIISVDSSSEEEAEKEYDGHRGSNQCSELTPQSQLACELSFSMDVASSQNVSAKAGKQS